MAASMSSLSNSTTDTPPPSTTTVPAFNLNPPPPVSNVSKNLRGLNKPKCIKCGNVARSRCPYQSCKSCCSKAQNPCEIHVLKGVANAPEKATSTNGAKVDQPSSDASHSGTTHRVASLRQLSNTFAQFNNLGTPARTRRPLTRKDAQVLNEWRFLKLKEHRDRNIEAENEAFDRYMRNVSLLEEVFCVNRELDGQAEEASSTMVTDRSVDDCNEMIVAGLKLKLRSNPVRMENFRKRVQYIVDKGLRELSKFESNDGNADLSDPDEMGKRAKKLKSWRAERASALSELIEKLNKARNQEDLKACLEMKSQLFSKSSKTMQADSDVAGKSNQSGEKENDQSDKPCGSYSLPKWFSKSTIDQESLRQINAYFCSLEEIEDL